MCGADDWTLDINNEGVGSPPRVRSRHFGAVQGQHRPGITSACAEQTPAVPRRTGVRWDHLRVCGADWVNTMPGPAGPGSPPRVRSRLSGALIAIGGGDHLRVCGADDMFRAGGRQLPGSPPRVRSRPANPLGDAVGLGITSACAEQTVVFYCVLSQLNGVEYLIYALRRVS